jgi:hypothetical protein
LKSLSSKFQGSCRSPLVTLNDIFSDIKSFSAVLDNYKDDQSKANFLRLAVRKQPWAWGAVEECLSNPSSFMPNKFQGFHGQLTAALTACATAGDLYTVNALPSCYSAPAMCMIRCAGPLTPRKIRMCHILVVAPAFLAILQ